MDRHSSTDLKQMQSVPLAGKIIMTKQRIREWYDAWNGDVYISFSGGKDSTVLKHIVDSMYPDVPSVFDNTGLEYPEIQRFAMAQNNVITIRPSMRFDDVIRKYGYPIVSKEVAQTIQTARGAPGGVKYQKLFGTFMYDGKPSRFNCKRYSYLYEAPFKISSRCCDVLKKRPFYRYEKETGRRPIVATMASESTMRRSRWIIYGCNAFDATRPTSQPMSFWTEQDVLRYLKEFNVSYCPVYGDIVESGQEQVDAVEQLFEQFVPLRTTGCDKTGCIFCGFGCHLEKEPNRFQRLKQTHPKQWEYCIRGGQMIDGLWQPSKEGLGLGFVLDYMGVRYE